MWDRMETFYHVVKAGSFTKAEDVLNKSQSTLSRTVALLEQQLGHRLLKRQIKGLILTRKGEEVFQTAQRMVMDVGAMKTNLDEKTGMMGRIRLSTTYAVWNYILLEPILEFNRLYPDILFDVFCNDHFVDIIQNEVDMALRPYDPHDNSLVQEYLFTLEAKLYASPKYIEKYGVPKSAEEFYKHKFVAFSKPGKLYGKTDWFLKLGAAVGKKHNCVLRANTVESLFKAAEDGMGIISGYEAMDILKNSNLINVAPQVNGPVYNNYLVYPKRLKDVEKVKVLEKFLLEFFQKSKQLKS